MYLKATTVCTLNLLLLMATRKPYNILENYRLSIFSYVVSSELVIKLKSILQSIY